MDQASLEVFHSLPLFDGFPYLTTRIAGAMHHLALLPADLGLAELERIARRQFAANRLRTSLVLGPERALYLSEGGSVWAGPPRCEFPVCDKLRLPDDVAQQGELLARQDRLRAFVAEVEMKGFLIDMPHGRSATAWDRERLSRRGPDGVPVGLEPCVRCGGYRGTGLLDGPGLVVDVFCRCENHNRCARCLEPLYERRLDDCGYFEESGQILHVPAFSAFGHRCWVGAASRARLSPRSDGCT